MTKTKLVELNTYTLDPKFIPVAFWTVCGPKDLTDLLKTNSWRTVENFLLEDDKIMDELKKDYRESIENKWNDEDFVDFCSDNVERIAKEQGYRIFDTIENKEKS